MQKALVRLAGDRSDTPTAVGVRAWLGRTVLSEVRMGYRARKRRRRHEQHAASSRPAPDIESIDHRDEVEVVLASLPESERRAVVLRFLHDMDYAEVAYILGTSRRAARVRVHRGVTRLRKTLGPSATAAVAALPLLGGQAAARVLLAEEAALAATTATAAGPAAALGGAVFMTTTTKVSFAACATLIASLVIWQSSASAPRSTERADRSSRARNVDPLTTMERKTETMNPELKHEAAARPTGEEPIPPGKGSVIGRVRFTDGKPLKRTRLGLWGSSRVVAETDDEGNFHIHGDWVGHRDLVIVGPRDYAFVIGHAKMKADAAIRLDLEIDRGVELAGSIRGEHGESIRSVNVTLRRPGANSENVLQGGFAWMKPGEAGDFGFRHLPNGEYTLLVEAKAYEPQLKTFHVEGRDIRLDITLKAARPLVVRFENLPEQAKGASTSWGIQRPGHHWFGYGGRAVFNENNELILYAPPAGRYQLSIQPSRFTPQVQRAIEIGDGALEPIVVRLVRGSRIEGLLRDSTGRAMAGTRVRIAGKVSKPTDAEGRFLVDSVEEGEREVWLADGLVRVSLGKFRFPVPFLDLKAHGQGSIEFVIPGEQDRFSATVTLRTDSGRVAIGNGDASQRVRISGLGAGEYRLDVAARGYALDSRWLKLRGAQQLDLGQLELRKLVEVPVLVTGAGSVRFLTVSGTLTFSGPGKRVAFTALSGRISFDETGKGVIKGLPAGTHAVTIRGQGVAAFETELTLQEGVSNPIVVRVPPR